MQLKLKDIYSKPLILTISSQGNSEFDESIELRHVGSPEQEGLPRAKDYWAKKRSC